MWQFYNRLVIITIQCTKVTFANSCELLRHGSHLWQLALALHCLPQPGEQCFAKNGIMAEYMDSWPQGIKRFLFIVMCFLQLMTQRSNSSWWVPWFTKYTKASEKLEHAMVIILYVFYVCISFCTTLLLKLAKSVCTCTKHTAVTSLLPVYY